MRIIDAYWENVVQLNCNCLGGKEYIQFQRDKSYHENEDKEAYYVKFVDDNDWDFKTRLRTFFKYRKDWKGFIDGAQQSYNGIYFNYEQLEEFYSIIYNDAADNEIIVTEDMEAIDNWTPREEFEKYPWSDKPTEDLYDWILFKSKDDLVLSADIFSKDDELFLSDFKFSWAFWKNIKKREI